MSTDEKLYWKLILYQKLANKKWWSLNFISNICLYFIFYLQIVINLKLIAHINASKAQRKSFRCIRKIVVLMMRNFLKVSLCILNFLIVVECKHFSVVAPAVIRNNEAYKIAVTSHGFENEEIMKLKLSVEGISQIGNRVEKSKEISLKANQTKTTKLTVSIKLLFMSFWRYRNKRMKTFKALRRKLLSIELF